MLSTHPLSEVAKNIADRIGHHYPAKLWVYPNYLSFQLIRGKGYPVPYTDSRVDAAMEHFLTMLGEHKMKSYWQRESGKHAKIKGEDENASKTRGNGSRIHEVGKDDPW